MVRGAVCRRGDYTELKQGKYLDVAEVKRLFTLEKWRESVLRYARDYGIW